MCVFPSKDQRDWNIWDKENNHKIPKTWNQYLIQFKIDSEPTLWFDSDMNYDKIGDSCSALFKIHKLIEVSYGGNITNKEWVSPNYANYAISLHHHSKHFEILQNPADRHLVLFHTKAQAEEFLKYPENIQLLKDYFMI